MMSICRCVSRSLQLGAAGALAVVILVGCGGDRGPERVIVSGTVTYRGKPLPDGIIRCVPLPSCPGPTSAAAILAGKYKVDSHGGVPVGTHKVQIEAERKVSTAAKPGMPPATHVPVDAGLLEQYLPEKYNTKTQLEVTVPSGSSPIAKDWNLTD
jgi:hypothetical protein